MIWSWLINDIKTQGVSKDTAKIIQIYLEDRTTTYCIGTVKKVINLTHGCPQGSKVGPRLWNITTEPALRSVVTSSERVAVIAYADDLALMVMGETKKETIARIDRELKKLVE